MKTIKPKIIELAEDTIQKYDDVAEMAELKELAYAVIKLYPMVKKQCYCQDQQYYDGGKCSICKELDNTGPVEQPNCNHDPKLFDVTNGILTILKETTCKNCGIKLRAKWEEM